MTKRFSFWLLFAIATTIVVFNSCSKDEPEVPKETTVTSVSLNKTELTLAIGESETLVATVTPENATNKTVTWESNNPSIATVDADGKITAIAKGTVTITVKAGDKTVDCVVTVINPLTHDESVEINGVIWTTRNVDMPGTFAENPESPGMCYQWNRNISWSSTDPITSSNGDTVWINSHPTPWEPIWIWEWEKTNDPCPQGWRVPTREEFLTLGDTDNVISEWTTVNGINGYTFINRATGNTIFLPTAGRRSSRGLENTSTDGHYWSSTSNDGRSSAFNLNFSSTRVGANDGAGLGFGFSVRCVAK